MQYLRSLCRHAGACLHIFSFGASDRGVSSRRALREQLQMVQLVWFPSLLWAEFGGSFRNLRAPAIAFIGLVFGHGGGRAQYGWVRVKTRARPNYRFLLVDYVWGGPGDSFSTGQTRLTPCGSTPRPEEQAQAPPTEGSLSAGWPSEPRNSWHGTRVGHEPYAN
jgi:hypothetical protein